MMLLPLEEESLDFSSSISLLSVSCWSLFCASNWLIDRQIRLLCYPKARVSSLVQFSIINCRLGLTAYRSWACSTRTAIVLSDVRVDCRSFMSFEVDSAH